MLLLLLDACGPDDAIRVLVDLALTAEQEGSAPSASRHLRGPGVIVLSADPIGGDLARAPGSSTLYAELRAAEGTLGILEISYARGSIPSIRYREIAGSEIVFQARITDSDVRIPEIGSGPWSAGEFSFVAVQTERDEGAGRAGRTYRSNGRVHPIEGSGSFGIEVDGDGVDGDDRFGPLLDPPAGGSGERGEEPSPNPPPASPVAAPEEEPRSRVPDDEDLDVGVVVDAPIDVDTGGGCEGGEPTSGESEGAGCEGDEPTSGESEGAGCEGESAGEGGCGSDTSAASGGCEGDATSSSCDGGGGGCSDCEGDVAETASRPASDRAGPRRAVASTLRLVWPIGLVAWINRRTRARLGRGLRDRDGSP